MINLPLAYLLENVAIMSIESDILRELAFSVIISDFSSQYSKKGSGL